jgi:hypothetical protein
MSPRHTHPAVWALAALLLLIAACGSGADGPEPTVSATTTGPTLGTTTTTEPPVECPTAPYQLDVVPTGVGETALDPDQVEPDVWTSVPGTSAVLFGRNDGTVAIALVRGTLPPVDWPGEKGEILIDGTRAAVGPHADGTWVAGWYEAPGERCDLYTMVFYPPIAPKEVEVVLLGMNRVGG